MAKIKTGMATTCQAISKTETLLCHRTTPTAKQASNRTISTILHMPVSLKSTAIRNGDGNDNNDDGPDGDGDGDGPDGYRNAAGANTFPMLGGLAGVSVAVLLAL